MQGYAAAVLNWPDLPLGMGTGRLCSLNGGLPIGKAARLLAQAHELGVRFVDTAPTYGQGHAEMAIGRLPSAVRDDLIICSKVGYSFGRKAALINLAKPVLRPILPWARALRDSVTSVRDRASSTGGSMHVSIEPETITSILESSLRRLRRGHLDILLLHDPSPASLDDPSNQAALSQLREAGTILAWGVSTRDPAVVTRAINTDGCAVVQVPGYPDWVDAHPQIMQRCADRGIAVIVNAVLTPLLRRTPGADGAGRQATAEECLAFALRQPGVRVALCGTRTAGHLEKNVKIVRRLATA
jgi:aryl-alcohol dehydrogenase-like predicted oxidoreductase